MCCCSVLLSARSRSRVPPTNLIWPARHPSLCVCVFICVFVCICCYYIPLTGRSDFLYLFFFSPHRFYYIIILANITYCKKKKKETAVLFMKKKNTAPTVGRPPPGRLTFTTANRSPLPRIATTQLLNIRDSRRPPRAIFASILYYTRVLILIRASLSAILCRVFPQLVIILYLPFLLARRPDKRRVIL